MNMIQVKDLYKGVRKGGRQGHGAGRHQSGGARGQFLAIVGPSGSGKSTLFAHAGRRRPPHQRADFH